MSKRIKETMQTIIEIPDNQMYTPRWTTIYCRGDDFGVLNFRATKLSTIVASYRTLSRRDRREWCICCLSLVGI